MEQFFKNKLNQQKVEWDKEALWEELEPQLPAPKSKNRFWWMILLPLFFASLYWLNTEKKIETSSLEENTVSVKEIKKTSDNYNTAIRLTTPNNSDSSDNSNISSKKESQKKEQLIFQKNNKSATQKATKNIKNNRAFTENKNTKTKQVASHEKEREIEIDYIIRERSSSEAIKLSLLPKLRFFVKNDISLPKLNVVLTESALIIKKSKPSNLFFELSGTLAQPKRTLNLNALDPFNQSLYIADKKLEEVRYANQYELGLGYIIKSRWFVKSGIGYQEIHERFKFDGFVQSDTLSRDYERARYFVNSGGDSLFFSGPASYIENQQRVVRHWNKFSYFNLPIELGFQVQKDKWTWYGTAGLNVFFASRFSGKVSNNFQTDIIDNPSFKLQKRMGYQFRFGTSYQLFDPLELLLNINYSKGPTFSRYEVPQTYSMLGVQVGLRYHLR